MADRRLVYDIIANDRASRTTERVGRSVEGLGAKLGKFGKFAAAGVAGAAVAVGALGVAAVKTGLETAASMQQAKIGFETLLGSAQKSEKFVSDLSKFAANTPFEFPGLVDSSRTLLGVGVAAKDVVPMLTDFGDAAGALAINQDAFQRIMLATSQSIAAGKFQVGDLNQLMNNGLPVWTLLSKAMGKTVPELRSLASHGKLLAKDVLPALQGQMHKDYGGAMAKQSKTLSGMWSTLQDTLSQGLAAAIEPLIPALQVALPKAIAWTGKGLLMLSHGVQWAVDKVSQFRGWIHRIAPSFKPAGDAVKVYVAYVKDMGAWLKTMFAFVMPAFRKSIDLVKSAFHSGGGEASQFGAVMKVVGLAAKAIIAVLVVAVAIFAVTWATAFKTSSLVVSKVLWPALKALAVFALNQFGLILDAAAWAFGWVPGMGPKLRDAQKKFHKFADGIIADMNRIPNEKRITVTVNGKKIGYSEKTGRSYINNKFIPDGRAAGGPVTARTPYLVGERGPELFLPRQSGTIVPNGGVGGVSIVQNISIDSRSDSASVRTAMEIAKREAIAAVHSSLSRGGSLARMTGMT
mgnify:CR=1 FL=1